MGQILRNLGNNFSSGFLCELAPQFAENFRRRHDDEPGERLRLGGLVDPVSDRRGETLLFELVPVRLPDSATTPADAGIGASWSIASLLVGWRVSMLLDRKAAQIGKFLVALRAF